LILKELQVGMALYHPSSRASIFIFAFLCVMVGFIYERNSGKIKGTKKQTPAVAGLSLTCQAKKNE
jgi:hypothetical protein